MKTINQTKSFVTTSKEEVNSICILVSFSYPIVDLYGLKGKMIQISKLLLIRVGSYKDNGLTCFENTIGAQAEKLRKDVFKT